MEPLEGRSEPGRGVGRPTLSDVAARAGVSRSTASLVIRSAPGPSVSSREAVLRAAADLGYHPDTAARALRRHRSRLLGIVFSVRDCFHADLVEAFYPAAELHGYDVVLSAIAPTRDERHAVQALLGSRCEALVLIGPMSVRNDLAALSRRLPVVVIGETTTGAPFDVVRTADSDGARQAVDHFVELGHRAIVHIDLGVNPGAAERRRGYREAMRRHGLAEHLRVLPGDNTEASGARAARAMLDAGELPTAIFAGNDRCAVGVLDMLRRAGVDVPYHVSVAGFDDSQLSRLAHLDLTTVRQDTELIAELAVRAAAERLDDGRDTARDIVLDPQLVVRGTSGPRRSVPPGNGFGGTAF
jgi:DNA-binding LacI/PurR family transcriptional regulator